jgi:ribosomal protein S25
LAISLNDFNAQVMLPHAPLWVQTAAPYVLASFPLFVIMMSIAAEMIVNLRPLESLDTEEYEADEAKRLRITQIRNDYLEKQVIEEMRALEIRAAMKSGKERYKPSFSWPSLRAKSVDADALTAEATARLREHYNEQINALNERINELQNAPITTPNMALHVLPVASEMCRNEHQNEQNLAPIDLESKRSMRDRDEQRNTEDLAPRSTPKRASTGDSELLKKVRRLVTKNREITAQELAQKTGKSRSHMDRLKRQILNELDSTIA